MSSKANRTRQQARERRAIALGLSEKHRAKERELHTSRELLLDSESKALLIEMREYGFAPPRGMPTQAQFSRYAEFRKTRASARASAIAEDELAILQAEGGLMASILERLRKPGIKDTAYANLMTLAIRAAALTPTISNMGVAPDSMAGPSLPADSDLDKLLDEFGSEE